MDNSIDDINGKSVDATAKRPNGKSSSLWLWAAIVIFVLVTQWPNIKLTYYKWTDDAAPEQTIAWLHDYDAALQASREQQKPVLAVFSASWCPPCQLMKREVWTDPEVSELVTAEFVPVYIDVDDAKLAAVTSRYQVSSIPTILKLDARGRVIDQRSSMGRSATIKFLKTDSAG